MILDKIGQEITVGCYLLYAHSFSSHSVGLRIGKVLAAGEHEYQRAYMKQSEIAYTIKVRGIDDDWEHSKPELTLKAGTLIYPKRCLVLSREQVPPAYWQMLENLE